MSEEKAGVGMFEAEQGGKAELSAESEDGATSLAEQGR